MQYKKSIFTWQVLLFLLIVPLFFPLTTAVESPFLPHIEIQPASQQVTYGETFQVDIHVDAAQYRLRGVQVDLLYPSSILHLVNITLGPLFGSSVITLPGSGDDGAGHMHYFVLTPEYLSSSSGVFLTLTFLVIGGTPDTLQRLQLLGDLYSWNYQVIPETQVESGFFSIAPYEYDEFFSSVSLLGIDSEGDGYTDAVEAHVDIETTAPFMTVRVQGVLRDPFGEEDDSALITQMIFGDESDACTLRLYGNGPDGLYEVTVKVYDNLNHLEDTWTGIFSLSFPNPVTFVNITPAMQTVRQGHNFSIAVTVDSGVALAGIQLGLQFNATLFTLTGVQEGTLFQGVTRQFNPGVIDNHNGTLTDVYGFTIGDTVSYPGPLLLVNFTAKQTPGTGSIVLDDVLVGSPTGDALPSALGNGSVTVVHDMVYDLNGDGRVNILDMVTITMDWGETGAPCWIPADINCDGVIDILDAIVMGHNWSG